MQLQAGKKYVCENGIVFVARTTNLPHYKFGVVYAEDADGKPISCSEVWTENGVAYHNDCGYNVIKQVR